ncbi:MAG: trimethylamine methyltransferase family protein [Paracoccaceae bacterium]
MAPTDPAASPTRRRIRHGSRAETGPGSNPGRTVDYRHLRNPFPPVRIFSDDRIAAIHEAALRVLEDLGIRVLLPDARAIFRAAGALVDEDTQMVRIGRGIVAAALAAAPGSMTLKGAEPGRDVFLGPDSLTFQPGAGCPHAADRERGRRLGTEADFRELVRLTQAFDVLHMVPPLIEPQDVPPHLRHYATMDAAVRLSDKVPFVYARGTPQVRDSFEMMRLARGLSEAAFAADPWCYTVINTNSPRQIDIPMAQGIIDFARAGQMSVITPFTLMGAMAPITVAGAVTLSHAEALAAITLGQLARPGAPMLYGTFTSNVDMKSGAPALGTPEQVKATLAAGQLARLIGLPWRCATGSAGAVSDVQAAHETQFALWGCLLAGANLVIHAAGWLESGLTLSYEKLITDLEVLQMMAELCAATPAGADEIGFEAIAEVAPGGHFFATGQTMARYQTAFYEPLVADWSNFGTWEERGGRDANQRATDVWKRILAAEPRAYGDPDGVAAMAEFAARRAAEGGAAPVS